MKNLLALTSILLPLQACWFTTASTDVDNEITVSVLGQVTNGQALAKTLVVIQNQSGDSIGSAWTDSLGTFSTQIRMDAQSWGWSARTVDSSLQAALPQPDAQNSIRVMLNPLNQFVWKNLGPGAHPSDFERRADSLLARTLGPGFRYSENRAPQDFRPLGQNQPHPLAAVVYQLLRQSTLEGLEYGGLLQNMGQTGTPLLRSEKFLLDLIAAAKDNGVDSIQLRQALEKWSGMPDQGGPRLDPLFKTNTLLPRNPALDTLPPDARQVALEGFRAMHSRVMAAGTPPESLFNAGMQSLWVSMDSLHLQAVQEYAFILGDPQRFQRALDYTTQMGDRLGSCLALYVPENRAQNPLAAAQACNGIVGKVRSQTVLSQWIVQGIGPGTGPLRTLQDRNTLKQALSAELSLRGTAALLPLLP